MQADPAAITRGYLLLQQARAKLIASPRRKQQRQSIRARSP
jgi:hypothetical protein